MACGNVAERTTLTSRQNLALGVLAMPAKFQVLKREAAGAARIEPATFRSAWITNRDLQFSKQRGAIKSRAMCSMPSRDSLKTPQATAWSFIVALLTVSCTQGASAPVIGTFAPLPRSGVNIGNPPCPPDSRAANSLRTNEAGPASEVLPFSLQLSPVDGPHPTIDEFLVRFSNPCVSAELVGGGGENRYVAHLNVGDIPLTHRLEARYDGHTARPLRTRPGTVHYIDVWTLTNEWTGISPEVHEIVVFAADARGVVPQTANGELAFTSCRFRVSDGGDVEALPEPHDQAFVLLGPEGTLHGSDAHEALVQVGAISGRASPHVRRGLGLDKGAGGAQLVVVRPDGGKEAHALGPGLFTLAPLRAGDYVLHLEPDRPETTALPSSGTLGYEHRITVNPE